MMEFIRGRWFRFKNTIVSLNIKPLLRFSYIQQLLVLLSYCTCTVLSICTQYTTFIIYQFFTRILIYCTQLYLKNACVVCVICSHLPTLFPSHRHSRRGALLHAHFCPKGESNSIAWLNEQAAFQRHPPVQLTSCVSIKNSVVNLTRRVRVHNQWE